MLDQPLPKATDRSGVLLLAVPLVAGFALWGLADPAGMTGAAIAITSGLLARLGWLVLLLSTAAVLIVLWLALGPFHHLRLGGADARPHYSTQSWIAMLFAAGMGTGLVVWGAAEPVTHMLAPPGGPLPLPQAARQAMVLTYLHWGLHAWSIYALCGLVIGWFAWRRGRPPLVSAPLAGLFAPQWQRPVAIVADSLAIVAVVFGVAGTLAMGMLTLRSGFSHLGDGRADALLPLLLLGVVGIVALASAASGIGRGIRRLSDFNIALALLLMLAVLWLGPTVRLLEIFVDSVGGYLAALPELAFRLRPFEGQQQWTADWTLTYMLWWLAWGPFVGVFIARISRGRTVRGFLAGVVLVPTLGSMLWFAIIGGSALLQLLASGGTGPLAEAAAIEPTRVLFVLLDSLPGGAVLAIAALLLLLVFLVTSLDSAAYVLAMMSSRGMRDPPVAERLAWGGAMLLLAGAILSSASVEVGRAMAILGALPFPAILVAQVIALFRDLKTETKGADAG